MARVVDLYPQKGKRRLSSPEGGRMPIFPESAVRNNLLRGDRDVPCHRQEPPFPQWFTRAQLCKKMGISQKALQYLLINEHLPFVEIAGETYIDAADVSNTMNALKRQHHPPTP